jgi:hypothetical protein
MNLCVRLLDYRLIRFGYLTPRRSGLAVRFHLLYYNSNSDFRSKACPFYTNANVNLQCQTRHATAIDMYWTSFTKIGLTLF